MMIFLEERAQPKTATLGDLRLANQALQIQTTGESMQPCTHSLKAIRKPLTISNRLRQRTLNVMTASLAPEKKDIGSSVHSNDNDAEASSVYDESSGIPPLTPASDCCSLTSIETKTTVQSQCDCPASPFEYEPDSPYKRTVILDTEALNGRHGSDHNSLVDSLVQTLASSREDLSFDDIMDSRRCCSIRWGRVTTRSYPIIPGEHPDCTEGPPLTIDWDYVSESSESIDDYEASRAPRKQSDDLRLCWLKRYRMLTRLGISERELIDAQKVSYKSRKQRESTLARLKFKNYVDAKRTVVLGTLGRAFLSRRRPEKK